MGGAFSSIADNVTAVYWNPAGLTQLKMREFSVMHLNYLVNIKSGYLSYAQPLGKSGTLGSRLSLLISHHSRRDDFGNEIGDFYNYEGVFSLAYAYPVKKNFSLGTTLKTFYSNLDNDKISVLVFDLGGLYKTPIEGVNLGLVIQNFNTGLKFTKNGEPVSPDFKVGISYNFNNLILATDIMLFKKDRINPYLTTGGQAIATSLGTEYSFVPPIFKQLKTSVRLGHQVGMNSTLGGLTGLTTGFGIEYRKEVIAFALDYAFVPFGDLGNTHRFSLTSKF